MEFSTDLLCFSYSCSPDFDTMDKELQHSTTALLPESVLYQLNQKGNMEFPLFFKVSNKETQFGRVCAVKSFTAPPGVCHIPYYIMSELGISEGETINIELNSVPTGSYIKIRPHKTEFINLSNPKAILEKYLSKNYPVLSKGTTISIWHDTLEKAFLIDIVESKPSDVIKTIDTDINLDFDKPLDYVEPEQKREDVVPIQPKVNNFVNRKINRKLDDYKNTDTGFIPFSGKGYRLGSS